MGIVFGLTGGVGMGKTTVANLLAGRGFQIIDTDSIARSVTERDSDGYWAVVEEFGNQVLDKERRLDRAALAAIVFQDSRRLRDLERILHPRIPAAWTSEVSARRQLKGTPIVVVIPLLFETASDPEFEEIVCVACGRSTQMERLAARGWSTGDSQARINSQLPIEHKMERSTRVIWTDVPIECVGLQCSESFKV